MTTQEYALLIFIGVLIAGMGYRIYRRRQDRANLPPAPPTSPPVRDPKRRGQGGRK